ncbi:MAG: hypothetical protein ACTSXP_07680 [Promethearchaeota archaeon]
MDAINNTSIVDLISRESFINYIKKARKQFLLLGLQGDDLRRCTTIAIRYGVNSTEKALESANDSLFQAIKHVYQHDISNSIKKNVKLCLDSEWTNLDTRSNRQLKYWVDKVCSRLGVDVWIDNSNTRWYMDQDSALYDFIICRIRTTLMDYLTLLCESSSIRDFDVTEIMELIIDDLTSRLSWLRRFNRRLYDIMQNIIERDVLGASLSNVPVDLLNYPVENISEISGNKDDDASRVSNLCKGNLDMVGGL